MALPAGRPTINDVAAAAGVSKSLVSLVMRGSEKVSDRRRRAVLEAAAQLGYRPNAAARSLVEQRTNILGVLVSDLHNPFFAEIVDGVEQRAETLGYRPLIANGRREPARERDVLEMFLELRADGLILLDPRLPAAETDGVARHVACVVVARAIARAESFDTVVNDDVTGAVLAVEHLVGLGHRHIAHISGGRGVGGGAARRRGYAKAMQAHGLAASMRVVPGSYAEEGGYDGARQLLATGAPPTAIFAANDLAAVGAMSALHEAGLAVPGDVSLVGYDNTHLAAIRHIGLTSVNQPRFEMGQLATTRVHERLDQRRTHAERSVLAPLLVSRTSCAAPRVIRSKPHGSGPA